MDSILKIKRQERGLSQLELSKLTGISIKTIQNYEQEHRSLWSMKVSTALDICNALQISVEELFDI